MAFREEFFFPSSDGVHRVHGLRWLPEQGSPRAVLQLVHGISEYIARYDRFATSLAEQGFVVVGHDHLGHGKTATDHSEYGFLAPEKGWEHLVEDVHTLREQMGQQFPGLPYFLFGHSMGSFVARTYLIDHPGAVDGCILSGTGQQPSMLIALGRGVAAVVARRYGPRHVSKLVTALSLGTYNTQFKPNRTGADWISRDTAVVDAYVADPMCRFFPTVGMFRDMMGGLAYIGNAKHMASIDPKTPIFLLSGAEDPVGDRGKGVRKVAALFQKAGCQDLSIKLYPQGRHEMLNETNWEEVYGDVLTWLEDHLP